MHQSALLFPSIELYKLFLGEAHNTANLSMNSVVFSCVCIPAGTELCALLANNNATCIHRLATKELYAQALTLTIPYI